ncbi:MAG TPA: hypothetical protein VGQ09_09220 [Chitinophagaceae bacterium]|jgi:hypothetical protein|nr:hypothetical protein [Chitinophagaceae bacterium]
MKIAKLKEHLPKPDSKNPEEVNEINEEIKKCYTVYDDHTQLKQAIQDTQTYNVWVRRKFKKNLEPEARERYENFVSGYLYYYDTEVRNNWIDHTIYFEWEKNKVTIYISPPAINKNNYKPFIQESMSSSPFLYEESMESPPADDESGATSDPPPPTGPPPPAS